MIVRVRICVLDGYTLNPGDNPWDDLAKLGELTVYDRSAEDQIVARAADAEVVLTNKTPLDAATIAALPRLRFIAVLATGYNIVDVEAAARRGVPVANVPEYGTMSVAQHVFALLLELVQRVGEHDQAVQSGEWLSAPDFSFWHRPPLELAGLTIGIVGFGRIGRQVARLADAFGMKVLVSGGRSASDVADVSVVRTDLDTLFQVSDVISLHCPLTPDNARMVNAQRLGAMKSTAFLINTARGALVDEAALVAALRAGQIAGAGLDVISAEPMPADSPLRGVPNCIITPHMAWASLAARRRLMASSVDNVRAFQAGHPINVVNEIAPARR